MKCDKCGKDKDFFSEMHSFPRIDKTCNCGSWGHPHPPANIVICYQCLELYGRPIYE